MIDENGTQLGIMSPYDALRIAQGKGLDLVEVSPKAEPPVCKILDYGRFKYEQAKKEKQKRANTTTITVKEVKFRPKTDDHDIEFKVKHIKKFLEEGSKVKLVIMFRGREMAHPEVGMALLERVLETVGKEEVVVEHRPTQEGRNLTMIIAPAKKKHS